MFAGHIGAALALAPLERRLPAATLVTAALLPDLLLWLFILLGWESVAIPADFALHHQPAFTFPYSHGLAASLGWAAAAAACGHAATRSARAAGLLAAAVLSHWLLDALVHRPELPLLGAASRLVGWAAWDHMALALAIESALVAAGLGLFLRGTLLPRGRALAFALLVLALLAFTIAGMTVAPAPPSPLAMAASSLVTLLATCGLVAWLVPARLVGGGQLADHRPQP